MENWLLQPGTTRSLCSPTTGQSWTQYFWDVSVAREPQSCTLINWRRPPLQGGNLFKTTVLCFLLLKFGFFHMKMCVYLQGLGDAAEPLIISSPHLPLYLDYSEVNTRQPWFTSLTYHRMVLMLHDWDQCLPGKIQILPREDNLNVLLIHCISD